MAEAERRFSLKLITPGGCAGPYGCDSVKLNITDGKNGKGGGSYGIRKGHAPAVLALAGGQVTAFVGGELVLSAQVGGGFALVSGDLVTVTVSTLSDLKTEG